MSEEHTKKVVEEVVRAVVGSLRTTPHNSTPFRFAARFSLISLHRKRTCACWWSEATPLVQDKHTSECQIIQIIALLIEVC